MVDLWYCILGFWYLCCKLNVYGEEVNNLVTTQKIVQIEIIHWELSPPFMKETNISDGLLPEFFRTAEFYCNTENVKFVAKYVADLGSRENMQRVLKSNTSYGEKELKNISARPEGIMWGPDLSYFSKVGTSHITRRNMTIIPMFLSRRFAVIQPKRRISLSNRAFNGVRQCYTILTFPVTLTVFFGIVVWAAEMCYNPQFQKSFTKGVGVGIYWSFVTMTTVGYGDIVPKTLVGRILGNIWMIVALIVSALVTATLTSSVASTAGLEIHEKNVAVLRDSYAEKIMRDEYFCNVTLYDSYAEVFDAVRKEEVFAAVVMHRIAAWYSKDIRNDAYENPLRIIYTIEHEIPINFLWGFYSQAMVSYRKCVFNENRYPIVELTDKLFKKNVITERISYDSLTDNIRSNNVVKIITVTTGVLVACGIALEIIQFAIKKKYSNLCQHTSPEKYVDQDALYKAVKDLSSQLNRHFKKHEETGF